jgi:hypothetical protein
LQGDKSARYLDIEVALQTGKGGAEIRSCTFALGFSNLADPTILDPSQNAQPEQQSAENPKSA